MNRHRVLFAALLAAVVALSAGCAERSAALTEIPRLLPATEEVADAAAEVALGPARARTEAIAWRNVQPYAGGGGVPTCANSCAEIRVLTTEHTLPEDVRVLDAWALVGDEAAAFAKLRVDVEGEELVVEASRGPRLTPGDTFVLVTELTHEGRRVFVRSPQVELHEAAP